MIELGAGCGLVGLVFAALGSAVLLTDLPNVMVRSDVFPAATAQGLHTDLDGRRMSGNVQCGLIALLTL